ncbi:MAG: hypothetical protein IPI07_02925 [Flavobacteriales bacterium]|nr:hypothetical protein [Flavobacteriales bacterium]
MEAYLRDSAKDFLAKTELLVADTEGDPVKKAAAIHDIVESIAKIPDQVLRQLYIKQCSRLLDVSEQALLSEMNKVLRRQYRKQIGGERVAEEVVAPELAPPQPEPTATGTLAQERDLLRMLLNYGHERILVPFQNDDGSTSEEETTLAETLFLMLAVDDILFDEPLFKEHLHRLPPRQQPGPTHRCLALCRARRPELAEPVHRPAHGPPPALSQLEGPPSHQHHTRARHPCWTRSRRVSTSCANAVWDRTIRDKQELLRTEKTVEAVTGLLTEIRILNEAKKGLAKRTGRVVVG